MIQLTLDPTGETVTLKLTAYLGGDRFGAYRDVCFSNGARFVPAEKANRAPVDAVPQILAGLTDAGLPVEVDRAVAERLREQAAEATALLSAGRERLAKVDVALAERGEALYPYQRTGVEWIAPRMSALLTDEMGLGKTVQALLALPDNAAALVIVPGAVRFAWEGEVRRWRPDLSPAVVASRRQFRWPVAGEVVIATYGVMPDPEEIPGMPPVGMVMMADEAHLLKNPRAKRTARWQGLREQVSASQGRVWLITGTPLLNRPPELWHVLKAAGLAEAAFGNWYNFVRLFDGRKGQYGYDWGQPSEEVPDVLRKVMLHRRRLEVLPELPTKVRQDIEVNDLDAKTRKLCDAVLETLAESGIDLNDADADVAATKITGAAFEQLSRARAALATAKIPAMLELVEEYEEADEPLVVFSAHTAPVEALRQREGWAVITGETALDERGRIVERFQAGELKGVAGTIGAMGVGVTLTKASHLLMVDLNWTPALNQQAEDRVCRIGQDRGVVVKRLVARHAVDARVVELLTEKQRIIEASVEASAVEADYVGASPAEALARAAEQSAAVLTEVEARNAEVARQAAEQAEQAVASVKRSLGSAYDGRELQVSGKFRSAANAVEEHAARALVQLASMDPDRAQEINGMGFNKLDGEFGHSLAAQIESRGLLSDKQWAAAVKMARKYRRQVGEA
jgi:hypothetical protein